MSARWVKVPLLFVLLGIPVVLYLFLQEFGKNEFDLPVYYHEGISDPVSGCETNLVPHTIKQFVGELPCQLWDCSVVGEKLVVFSFIKSGCSTDHLGEIARVCNYFEDQTMLHTITVPMDAGVSEEVLNLNTKFYGLTREVWSWWQYQSNVIDLVQCGFNLSLDCATSAQVVLLDKQFQIRGYYLASDLQEMDRLLTEIKILLSKEDV